MAVTRTTAPPKQPPSNGAPVNNAAADRAATAAADRAAAATDRAATAFIHKHVAAVEPLSKKTALAAWMAQTTGQRKYEQQGAVLKTKLLKIYADPKTFKSVEEWHKAGIADPLLARQIKVLHHAFQGQQFPVKTIEWMVKKEKHLEHTYNNFRGTIRGKPVTDNDIKQILKDEDNPAVRKAAWEAGKQIGAEVADQLLELVGVRNEAARRLGYSNFYTMKLTLQELSETRTFELFNHLDRLTAAPYLAFKDGLDKRLARRFKCKLADLRPWHYHDVFFQGAPASDTVDLDRYFADKNLERLTAQFYAALGLGVDDIIARSDLYERPHKCQHAFCMDLDRKSDIRVLCNVRPQESWMSTMLHEFGHAAYDKYLDPKLPWTLRRPAHILTTEAIAMLMGRLTKDPRWLTTYAGLPASDAKAHGPALAAQQRTGLLVFVRWGLVMTHFEQSMYRNSRQDLNELWWDLVERYQKIRRPDKRNKPDWAAKIHLATAPVYYQNYLLGEMVASQLMVAMERLVGHGPALVSSKDVGAFLKEKVFRPGATRTWEESLEFATGERLNPRHFAKTLSGA